MRYTLHHTEGYVKDLTTVPVLVTVDFKPELYTVYKIQGVDYIVTWLDSGFRVQVNEVVYNENPGNYSGYDLECPYCGYKHTNPEEFGDSGEAECGRCGSDISFEREIICHYTVSPVKSVDVVLVEA